MASMAFQPGKRLQYLFQVGILARPGEVQDHCALKLRAIEVDAEGLADFLLEEPFLDFAQAVGRGMAARGRLALRRDLHPLHLQLLALSFPDLDH